MKTITKMTRLLASALAIALFFTLSVPTFAYDAPADVRTIAAIPGELTGKTIILQTNDVHGAIGKYAYVASLKENLAGRGADVILVDSGDFSQGTPYVSASKGATAVTVMNAAGYDVVTLGNHEFDYGYDQLRSNLSQAKFKVLCADVLDANGNPIYDPNYVLTTASGLKLGFFGMETPETQTKVNPGLIKGISFLSKSDIYKCAQAQTDALKSQGADLVICLSHLGVDEESAPDGHRSIDMYAKTKGIDLILDGHSHTVMTKGAKNEPVLSTGTKVENIGVVIIDNASKKIEDNFLISLDGLQPEVKSFNVANDIIKKIDNEYNVVFAKSETLLDGNKAPGNRTQETNLGDLITDALKWSVLKTDGAVTVDKDHVVAITNGGGIRATIKAGNVTKADLNTVLPFGNTVAVVYVTGEELLEALEASTFAAPEAVGGYPQTSGIKFILDTTKPFAQGTAYPKSTYYAPSKINRVTIQSINDQPFNPKDTYAVVTNNFCAAGGDTYYSFVNASSQYDTGIVMDEAVMDYVNEVLGGTVTSAQYGKVRGDQTIITADTDAATIADAKAAVQGSAGTQATEATAEEKAEAPAEAKTEEKAAEAAPEAMTEEPAKAETATETPAETAPAAEAAPADTQPSAETYVVVPGDNLWKIAAAVYGDGNKWSVIYDLNKDVLKDANSIKVGQELKVK
ncbi:5'-nucleotidase C-terminal domain-containing protein [Butyrivibrio sp. X503]|uniref:5'-nucleotidase C-terminal domain-containing protein n=1 Tax=Butyrivibrio sp. X503 TaxID=2364878 RepID=UPI001313E788|nr:5'-nucleotidase C-terminal domain-containing protein [Butyrivibrio sp. X503]